MKIDRRTFLGAAAALGANAAWPLRLPAVHGSAALTSARAAKPLLVVIYLRGGQDALDLIVPLADPDYLRLRPTIGILPPGDAKDEAMAALPLDRDFGLHPSLAPLLPLWQAKSFAPIVCVGSPHPTRSHFDAQDFMEYAAPGSRTMRDGWLNRFLAATATAQDSQLRAVGMQGTLPRSLRGTYSVAAVPDGRGAQRKQRAALLDEFDELYGAEAPAPAMAERADDEVRDAGVTTIHALRRYDELAARDTGSKVEYPRGGLGSKLQRIAHLVRAGEPVEIACADYNGWDHHTKQGGNGGQFAPQLAHLAASIAAFVTDLGPHFERTLILTMTEFGRTCAENGNAGTDHGHGSAMLAVGGKLAGGQVLGDWTGLRETELYEGRDLRVTTDFREVFRDALGEHLAFDIPKSFFPDYRVGKGVGMFGARRSR